MEKYIAQIVIGLLVMFVGGLVKLAISALTNEIREIKTMLNGMVSEKECKARHEGIDKDLNNLGNLIRSKP